jgi:hypothetical protein
MYLTTFWYLVIMSDDAALQQPISNNPTKFLIIEQCTGMCF